MHAGILIGNVDADVGWRALRVTGEVHQSAHGLGYSVVSRPGCVRTILTVAGDRAHDQAWVQLPQLSVAQTILGQGARAEILDHHIHLWD